MIPRVIPTLLLDNGYLIKTKGFKRAKYVGDPINTVKLFNEKRADELVLLDVTASEARRKVTLQVIREIVSEAFMPVAYGGGIDSVDVVESLLNLGVEKVVMNRATWQQPQLVVTAVTAFGSQAIVGSMDVSRRRRGQQVRSERGKQVVSNDPVGWAKNLESLGVGEILLTSIDREGSRAGYDVDLIGSVSAAVDVPVIAHGGAGSLRDMREAALAGASALAAGQMFTFHGPRDAVLITYPEQSEIIEVFKGV